MEITRTNFCVYVCASETGIVFTLQPYCPSSVTAVLTTHLKNMAGNYVSWAYEHRPQVPSSAAPDDKVAAISRLRFWSMLNRHVAVAGPIRPVRLFRHGLQVVYRRRKGGADAAAQFRAELISSGVTVTWEQKLMLSVFKTLLVNSFVAWRLVECENLLVSICVASDWRV